MNSEPPNDLTAAQKSIDAAIDASKEYKNQATTATPNKQAWSSDLVIFLSSSILIFTFLVLVLCSILMWRNKSSSYHILRTFGILFIIGVSAILLITGYDNTQLTPIIGLFGAIAGYLLGKETGTTNTKIKENNEPHANIISD